MRAAASVVVMNVILVVEECVAHVTRSSSIVRFLLTLARKTESGMAANSVEWAARKALRITAVN